MAKLSSSNGLEKRPKLRFPGFDEPWKTNIFDEIFSLLPNNTLSRADLASCGDILNVHYGDVLIKYGSILDVESDEIPYITTGKESKKQCYLSDGDVIIADTAEDETVGKCTEIINTQNAKIEAGLHTIPCHPRTAYAPMFLGYYMNSPYYHKQLIPLMQGVKVLSVSKSNIGNTLISAPVSYSEQEKIVDLLHLLDCRMRKQQEVIDSLKKYKRGLLMHFFSDDTTRQWRQYTISQIGKVITGNTPPTNDRNNYDGDLMFCSPRDIGEQKYISSTEKRVSPKGFALGRPIPTSSVIVTCIGLIGKLGIATTDMITNQQINALIVSEDFDHEFIYYAFENFFPKYRSKVSMQTLPILSKSEFEKLLIKVPNLNVQHKISNYLAGMDKRIEQTQQELNVIQDLRRGIIQKLFI